MAVRLKVTGIQDLQERLRRLEGRFRQEFAQLVANTAVGIADEAKVTLEPKTYTGQARALTVALPVHDGLTYVVRSSAKHAIRIEEGTKPGTRPNPEALERWAWLKLHKAGLGYAIAKAIRKRGIEPFPFFRPAIRKAAAPYIRAAKDILKRAAKKGL